MPFAPGRAAPAPPFVKFYAERHTPARFVITGNTFDSTGAPLGGVEIDFYYPATKTWAGSTVSDGSGSYTIDLPVDAVVQGVMYKAGTPDLASATVRTLTPVAA